MVNVAFATFTSTGNNTFQVSGLDASPDQLNYLVQGAHDRGIAAKVAIGGATYGLSGILTSGDAASGMAKAVNDFVSQYNLDGVDLDIEDYPAPEYQIDLIADLRSQLGDEKQITYTPKAPASTTYPYDDTITGAYQYLDGINIMCYDAGSSYNYQQDVQSLIGMGVPAEKITVGLMPGNDDMGAYTSLDDVSAAAQYALDKGLRRIMTWDMDRDYNETDGLNGSAINTAASVIHPDYESPSTLTQMSRKIKKFGRKILSRILGRTMATPEGLLTARYGNHFSRKKQVENLNQQPQEPRFQRQVLSAW